MDKVKEAILKTVKSYLEEDKVKTVNQINRGICYQFAEDAVDEVPMEMLEEVQILNSDEFKIILDEDGPQGNEEWDLDCIQKDWQIKLPDVDPEVFARTQDNIYHVWLYHNKKHYDAECPEGVDSFFELPIFKRILENK